MFPCRIGIVGGTLRFPGKQLPLAQAVSVSLCQAANIANGSSTRQHGQASKVLRLPRKTQTLHISTHATKKQKHAKKRGNPPPSRHPDHILLALASAAREAYWPHHGPPELMICTEMTGVLWPNKTLRGLSFLSTNQPLHHKQVMLTHVLNTQNSTRISFSGIWKSTVI